MTGVLVAHVGAAVCRRVTAPDVGVPKGWTRQVLLRVPLSWWEDVFPVLAVKVLVDEALVPRVGHGDLLVDLPAT